MRGGFLCWCATCCVFATGSPAMTEEPSRPAPTDLLRGTIARADVVFSGRMTYTVRAGIRGEETSVTPGCQVVFSGPSWRRDVKVPLADLPVADQEKDRPGAAAKPEGDFTQIVVSHQGKTVAFTSTPQQAAPVALRGTVEEARPLRSVIIEEVQTPPVFAGTLWHEGTRKFIERHRDKAVVKPPVKVNDVTAHVLEWTVSGWDCDEAFGGVDDDTRGGGLLRLYVSPELGYALPRVEIVGKSGRVRTVFDSSDFVERGDVFIPRKCSMQNQPGGKGFFHEYEILEAKNINEPIPETEFVIVFPLGTVITEARAGRPSVSFEVTDGFDSRFDELPDVIPASSPPPDRSSKLRTALLIGAGLGIVLLAASYFLPRLLRGKAR